VFRKAEQASKRNAGGWLHRSPHHVRDVFAVESSTKSLNAHRDKVAKILAECSQAFAK